MMTRWPQTAIRIKAIRLAAGWTTRQLGDFLDVPENRVWLLEKGFIRPMDKEIDIIDALEERSCLANRNGRPGS
jgi:transcriptional regulator with XRE-family HTH domain